MDIPRSLPFRQFPNGSKFLGFNVATRLPVEGKSNFFKTQHPQADRPSYGVHYNVNMPTRSTKIWK